MIGCPKCGSVSHPNANLCPQEGKSWRTVRFAPQGLRDKQTDIDLREYAKTRSEGNLPFSTRRADVEQAKIMSNELGRAYRADDMTRTVNPELADAIRAWTPEERAKFREGHSASD